jgi:hypothetical protein
MTVTSPTTGQVTYPARRGPANAEIDSRLSSSLPGAKASTNVLLPAQAAPVCEDGCHYCHGPEPD